MNNKVVCHISYHNALDDRIYWKELVTLKEAGYNVIHLCVSERDATYTTEEGIQIIEIKRKKITANLWLNRVAQLLFKNKGILKMLLQKAAVISAAIYHYHDLQINAIAKQIKALPHAPKLIYDVHEVYWMLAKEKQKSGLVHGLKAQLASISFKRWEIKNASSCDYIIATDEYTLNYFKKKLPNIPCSIIYNYSYFNPDDIDYEKNKKYHFIYTGLLSKGRGIKNIVQGISLVKKEYNNIKVLLIGPFEHPEFEREIKALIAKNNLEATIEIHDTVPFKEIEHYYKISRVGLGLFHHTPKYTTFIPIKLFEYMAFGLPVIFSNHGPSSKIIKQSKCGVLINPKNALEIYGAMITLLQNEALYQSFSINGINAVKQQYNWASEKSKLLNIYQTLTCIPLKNSS